MLGDDRTSCELDLGSKFMAQSPQVSSGPDLRKFKYSEHLHSLLYQYTLVVIHRFIFPPRNFYVLDPVEYIPPLPKRKIPLDI